MNGYIVGNCGCIFEPQDAFRNSWMHFFTTSFAFGMFIIDISFIVFQPIYTHIQTQRLSNELSESIKEFLGNMDRDVAQPEVKVRSKVHICICFVVTYWKYWRIVVSETIIVVALASNL